MLFLSTVMFNTAFAGDMAVVPLLSKGLESAKVIQMTNLMSAELDFSGQYDFVDVLESKPSTLTSKCLNSNSCLREIANSNNVDALLAGAVAKVGSQLDFYVVYFDNNMIVRKLAFSLENKSSVIADEMGGYIQEVLTGVKPQKEDAMERPNLETTSSNELLGDDLSLDDLSMDSFDSSGLADQESQKAEEEARRRAEEEARRRAEEEARRAEEEARRRAEEEARRRAEAEIARIKAEEAKQASNNSEDEDLELLFKPSTVELVNEGSETNSNQNSYEEEYTMDLNFDDNSKSPPKRNKPSKKTSSYDNYSSSSYSETTKKSRDNDFAAATIALRFGSSKFQALNFVTYGGEVSYYIKGTPVSINLGAEGYATKRIIPEELLEEGEPPVQWNIILPINLGACAHFKSASGAITPYAGADFMIIPGYVRNTQGVATGFRARGGVDFGIADNLSFNLNTSLGLWSGDGFQYVQQDLTASSFIPQISAGTVFIF
ncbi:MAG: hypothetical protein CMK59_10710 [Proteobacteria bacterium]|nr:hypothetical protein [Pseudomonadota bacterium]